MDRIREAQEDNSIISSLNIYTSKREESSTSTEPEKTIKKEKKSKKIKKLKQKISSKVGADKEGELESHHTLSKESKKKKFAIF